MGAACPGSDHLRHQDSTAFCAAAVQEQLGSWQGPKDHTRLGHCIRISCASRAPWLPQAVHTAIEQEMTTFNQALEQVGLCVVWACGLT